MDNSFGQGLNGLATVVSQKWFAAMGLAGMILFLTTLVIPIPSDPVVAGCVGLMMMGWGFGQTECRTFRNDFIPRYRLIIPAWRLTVTGAIMFVICIGAAIRLAIYLL
ncbi:hypothetical protein CEW89_08525 [Celeribacter ethanolicus]|uniref:Uncharacterized protein n=1 Tax=Celeribacter ethanolicus TaxID=1758178 RepID=A0A291GBP2_9RHOB|nr:hypothetical protein CEW89_08525 [Celeribacter ethanolicus]